MHIYVITCTNYENVYMKCITKQKNINNQIHYNGGSEEFSFLWGKNRKKKQQGRRSRKAYRGLMRQK